MHRSGTSLVTSILQRMGLYLGPDDSFLPAAPDNERGFYEQQSIFEINEALLEHYGGAWHEIPDLPSDFTDDATLGPLRDRARVTLNELYAGHRAWVMKDPRFSVTLPFWRPLLPRSTCYVVCVRHPDEVAASLAKRNSFDFGKSLALWLLYTRAALRNTASTSRFILVYGTGETDWRHQIDQLAEFVRQAGAPVPDALRPAELAAEYSGRYHHHREQPRSLLRAWSSKHAEGVLFNAILSQVGSPGLSAESLQTIADSAVNRIREKDNQLQRLAEDREAGGDDPIAHRKLLEILLRESEEALAREREEAAVRRAEIGRLVTELGAERQQLTEESAARQELERRAGGLEQEVSAVRASEEMAFDRIADLERERQAILDSRSWRLTSPLRAALGATRRLLRRRLRLETRSLESGRVSSADERRRVRLEPSAGSLPPGWLRLELLFDGSAWVPARPGLDIDYGGGFEEEGRVQLPPPVAGHLVTYLRLRLPARALRFDPGAAGGRARLRSALARPVTSLEVAGRHLWRRVRRLPSSPHGVGAQLSKASKAFSEGGLPVLLDRLQGSVPDTEPRNDYGLWVERYGGLGADDREKIARRIEALASRPRISLLMAVQDVPASPLRETIGSLREQLYPDWQLCIAAAGSSEPEVERVLADAAADPRVRISRRETSTGLAAAGNGALELAAGEWVARLDAGDRLSEHALYRVVEEIVAWPEAQLIYSDEDELASDGSRREPRFKPSFNPDLLLSYDFIGRLAAIRRRRVDRVGRFRRDHEDALEYDLILRVVETLRPHEMRHIPEVLYHRRSAAAAEAASGAGQGGRPGGRRALRQHLERRGLAAELLPARDESSGHRLRYRLPAERPLVSLLIPSSDRVELLERAVSSILEKSSYPSYEILVLDNGSVEAATERYYAQIRRHPRVSIEVFDGAFNFSAINNFGAARARGAVLGLVNSDVEVISENWLEEMVGHALRPEVGAVGARLYYPDGRLQHGGVVLGIGGVAGHSHKYLPGDQQGYMGRAQVVQNVSAVTAACLLVRRETYEAVGGLDESLAVAFNDVDFCLRLRTRGLLNVWTPYAELYHHESLTRGPEDTLEKRRRFERDSRLMLARWRDLLENDPCYSPNLTLQREDFSFAYPPRVRRIWEEAEEGNAAVPVESVPRRDSVAARRG